MSQVRVHVAPFPFKVTASDSYVRAMCPHPSVGGFNRCTDVLQYFTRKIGSQTPGKLKRIKSIRRSISSNTFCRLDQIRQNGNFVSPLFGSSVVSLWGNHFERPKVESLIESVSNDPAGSCQFPMKEHQFSSVLPFLWIGASIRSMINTVEGLARYQF